MTVYILGECICEMCIFVNLRIIKVLSVFPYLEPVKQVLVLIKYFNELSVKEKKSILPVVTVKE